MFNNVIVGQSGGPTAVINSSLAGVYETAKNLKLGKVYGMLYGVEGLLKGQYVDLNTKLCGAMDIELLKRTPSSFLGSCRYKLPQIGKDDAVYENLFAILKDLEIGYFIYIGGNDSMDTIQKLSAYGKLINSEVRFMGVPKTIDNDLACTDHTPGYGSAAKYIGTVIKELVRDSLVYDLRSVTVVEIMGRNAGWLTGAAALAKSADCEGADMICLPETCFDLDEFIAHVRALQKTKKSVLIAVSEGVRLKDGRYVCELMQSRSSTDVFGHKSLAGTAKYLADEINTRIGCKARAVELNTLQRCSAHISSRADVTEAYQVGGAAMRGAYEGLTGKMSALVRLSQMPYMCGTEFVDINDVANCEKQVPSQWIDAENMGVTQEFLQYVRPLIQAELTPICVDGLPFHISL
ncbi:MAG: 6-phosphofructokinase [Oscillospiraceae bacterium]